MAKSNFMVQQAALRAWSPSGNIPLAIAIGTGSQERLSSNTALANEVDRNAFTGGSVDLDIINEVTMQSDYNALEVSGITMTEFGVFDNVSGTTGSLFNDEPVSDITFAGTTELQIQVTFQTF